MEWSHNDRGAIGVGKEACSVWFVERRDEVSEMRLEVEEADSTHLAWQLAEEAWVEKVDTCQIVEGPVVAVEVSREMPGRRSSAAWLPRSFGALPAVIAY